MPLDATTFTNILGSMFFRLLNFSLNESRKPMSGMSETRTTEHLFSSCAEIYSSSVGVFFLFGS